MVDLHMHTTYSDGTFSVKELIELLNKENIRYASITDHNNVDAYIEFLENGLFNYFEGTMFPGTELQTIVDNKIIEILVYNYDLKFKKYVDDTRQQFWKFHEDSYRELINRAIALGLKVVEPQKEMQNGYYSNMKFQDALKSYLEYNKKIVDERIITDLLYFYRHEFQNPDSIFFVDNSKSFPKLDDLLYVAHECRGVTSLAHIDEYQSIEDKNAFLEYLSHDFNIDAIECFHPVISESKRLKYIEFAECHGLMVSAGSDFHGPNVFERTNINTPASIKDVTILKKLL